MNTDHRHLRLGTATSCEAKLENGEIVDYDLCSEHIDGYDALVKYDITYIGKGVIYSIDGKIQTSSRELHFFKRSK